ncbi:MAG TPA: cyclopropane-fatty-acyl-phospholipid synthase family protein [Rhizomicrobium sp.]|nr:cyclopropane-fatty-acyl-phospholipid synthase family protein [Rhizomicrobium sp.]
MLGLLLNRLMKKGSLTVIHPSGKMEIFGIGAPHVTVKFHDQRAMAELVLNPDLALGELYMDGRLTVEEGGTIAELLDLMMMNLAIAQPGGLHKMVRGFRRVTRRFAQFNPAAKSKEHVAHHYDLDGRLYDLFLGRDKQYSCAYFSAPGETLEEAQIGKKRHIAAKLHLDRPNLKVLDIGCGWGGLALNLAQDCSADVLGVTLSEEQLGIARQRAEAAKIADRCRFELVDYRALGGRYDRIVSVGMFEHVGAPYYDAFFAKVRDLLTDDGVMLLHSIGRTDGPGSTNSWIAKYIFPGGYVPALSEMMASIEKSGLMVTDVEVLRLHYAQTLREWSKRFQANRARAAELYDERFCRMWEFYLAGAEMAFRHEGQVVFQVQLARKVDSLPITRDYMLEDERTMRFAGTESMPAPLRAV